jgi:multidrug resistance efflux pump
MSALELIQYERKIAELTEKLTAAEAKIKALEWVAKDNSLRTHDGLTEKIAEKDSDIVRIKDVIQRQAELISYLIKSQPDLAEVRAKFEKQNILQKCKVDFT